MTAHQLAKPGYSYSSLNESHKYDLGLAMPGTYQYQTLALYPEHEPPIDSPKNALKCLEWGPYKKDGMPPEVGVL